MTSIKIPDNLEQIVKTIDTRNNLLIIQLGIIYDGNTVIVWMAQNFSKFEKDFEKKLKGLSVDEKHIFQIFSLIQENHKIIYPENFVIDTIPTQKVSEKSELENVNISFDEWYSTLNKKYTALKITCEQNFPHVWPTFDFALSIKSILHVLDITLPFAGIILGPPSSSKTLVLEMLRDTDMTFYTDSFTPRSLVSHNTSVPPEKLQEIDMLPKIKDKVLITPELAPIFSAKDDDLLQTLGIITRIMDGHGYESDSGAYGHRGYSEDIMFTWLGAAVDIPRKVYKHLGTLGPKLYFYRVSSQKNTNEEYLRELEANDFTERKKQVKEKLQDYLKWFNYNPKRIPNNKDSQAPIKIGWDPSKGKEILRHIVRLGQLLAHLRGVSVTWGTGDTGGSDYGYTTPTVEVPNRAMISLMNLARGHAIVTGRNYLSVEDIPIAIKTVLSTAPLERVLIFDLLLNMGGELTRPQIEKSLRISKPTALKTMRELHVLGLVDFVEEGIYANTPSKITLKQEFDWFLSEEFKKLREGYTPGSLEDIKSDKTKNGQEGVKKNYPHTDENKLCEQAIELSFSTECPEMALCHTPIQIEGESTRYIEDFFEYIDRQGIEDKCNEKLPPPAIRKGNTVVGKTKNSNEKPNPDASSSLSPCNLVT